MNSETARQSPRIDYQVPVQLAHPSSSPAQGAIEARTINVSAGGMALGVAEPLRVGETVVCHIALAGGRASLTGEVTWTGPGVGTDGGDATARIGVRFERDAATDGEVLDQLLAAATGPTHPVSVRFEGMDRHVLARGELGAQSVRLSAALPILASGTPVDMRLHEGDEGIGGQVLSSRLVHRGRTPVLEVDIEMGPEDGPRTRRRTFYGRASKLKTLEQPVAHIGARAGADNTAAQQRDTEPPGVDPTWHRARQHTRRIWQPTPNSERSTWDATDPSSDTSSDDTARDLHLPRFDTAQETDSPTAGGRAMATPTSLKGTLLRWKRTRPGWSTVVAAAFASALGTAWLLGGPARPAQSSAAHIVDAAALQPATPDRAAKGTAAHVLTQPDGAATAQPALAAPGRQAPGSAATPDTALSGQPTAPADRVVVTANRQQTRVQVPIDGKPTNISTHLWKKPSAVVARLQGTRTRVGHTNHHVGRHGVSHVSVSGDAQQPQVRVITTHPVLNYSVTATDRWLEVRITPQPR